MVGIGFIVGAMNKQRTIEHQASLVAQLLGESGQRVVTAESCTGGWVAKVLTDIAGSSAWFDRGFVTYSNEAKAEQLGVRQVTLKHNGAVSEATVLEMAAGALRNSRGTLSVAVSGIAGPGGGTADKPVGTVWFAWAGAGHDPRAKHLLLVGDRDEIRRAAVVEALQGVLDLARSSGV